MQQFPLILRLDKSGMPVEWFTWQDALRAHALGQILWSAGENYVDFHGGLSRLTGEQTIVTLPSIIAVNGKITKKSPHVTGSIPRVSRRELVRRDQNLCLYCGQEFPERLLTRDHVLPRSKGGSDDWTNLVSCCYPCNNRKSDRTPEAAGMPLLAVPYRPTLAEWLVLRNRQVLADQMSFLKPGFSKHSRLLS